MATCSIHLMYHCLALPLSKRSSFTKVYAVHCTTHVTSTLMSGKRVT
ncbi:Uncharacterised protein [Vibrio cholerae]|nr:Uncharacterised protein [Vibrio cholerae]